MNAETPLAENTLPAGTWRLDPDATRSSVVVKKLGFLTVELALELDSGQVVVDDQRKVASVSATLKAGSVSSGNAKRDTEIRSDGFLDVASNPYVSFTSTDVVRTGLDFTANGALTIKGAPSSLVLNVTAVSVAGEVAAFNFSGTCQRKSIGLGKLPPLIVADDLQIRGSAKANLT